jgi:hypothetical protein
MRSTARVWKDWECAYTLKGHDRAVWAVLALDNDEYLTGNANPRETILIVSIRRPDNPVLERRQDDAFLQTTHRRRPRPLRNPKPRLRQRRKRCVPLTPTLKLISGSSTSGPERGNNSSSFTPTQTLSTPSPSSPPAKSSRRVKTGASRFGGTESVSRRLLSPPSRSGLVVRSPTAISSSGAVIVRSGCLPGMRGVLLLQRT